LSLADMTTDRRFQRPYRQTFAGVRNVIDDDHFALLSAPLDPRNNQMIDVGFDGWLLPSDASKLYEMAYCANGDILELGTYRGLSTSIIVRAMEKSNPGATLTTIDLDESQVQIAKAAFDRKGISREHVSFIVDDAIARVERLASEGRKFSFIFVDHSHAYEHMLPTCKALPAIISPGHFVLFHDYNDVRNTTGEWGVYQAVQETLQADFDFYGIYGCTGLFRRR
jgi:cephalosporin hydroxylase